MINQPFILFILGGLVYQCSLTFHQLKRNNNSSKSLKTFFFKLSFKNVMLFFEKFIKFDQTSVIIVVKNIKNTTKNGEIIDVSFVHGNHRINRISSFIPLKPSFNLPANLTI